MVGKIKRLIGYSIIIPWAILAVVVTTAQIIGIITMIIFSFARWL